MTYLNENREPYVPAPVPPDPARDARVAARRAADARRAGAALDKLFSMDAGVDVLSVYRAGWDAGYEASEEHHNRHYGVPDHECLIKDGRCLAPGHEVAP